MLPYYARIWRYALITHYVIAENMTLVGLTTQYGVGACQAPCWPFARLAPGVIMEWPECGKGRSTGEGGAWHGRGADRPAGE